MNAESMDAATEIVLFDLGGVLLELGESPLRSEWFRGGSTFTLEKWFSSSAALDFEKGLLTGQQFADQLKQEFGLTVDADSLLEQFTRWPVGIFSGVPALLERLSSTYRLALLTNTNELHWPRITGEFEILQYFERVFASHIIGLVKPEAAIFEHVIIELGTPPENILFLDDSVRNVEAAGKLGINSVHVHNFEHLQAVIGDKGL